MSDANGLIRKAVVLKQQMMEKIARKMQTSAQISRRFCVWRVCAAVYPLLTLLDGTFRFRQRRVDLRCDFDAEETAVRLDALIHLRPWYLVCYLFRLIGNYLKRSAAKHE